MSQRATNHEESLSREYRRAEGIYYTPRSVVVEMLQTLSGGIEGRDICDPCCGCGNFLVEALKMGASAERLYGFDRDEEAVRITRERIFEVSGFDGSRNIVVGDFWEEAPARSESYDVIISNPPWGAKLTPKRRAELGDRYGIGHSADSSAFMLMAALTTLREGGEMSCLLPDAFFNIGTFEGVRHHILGLSMSHLCDYGRPFAGLMTRAESITLRKRASRGDELVRCRWDGVEHKRLQRSFISNPKAIINMWLDDEGAKAVEAIYARPHLTLLDNAVWGMGIVTGDNTRFCHEEPSSGDVAVVRGYNITKEGLTPLRTYIAGDMSLYQQVAHSEFYRAGEKILYRFIADRPLCCLDREQHYLLNSANGLILNEGFELSAEGVVERLNSDEIVWLFRAIFRTHKILRHDIEQLPLHLEFEQDSYAQYLGIEPTAKGSYKIKI